MSNVIQLPGSKRPEGDCDPEDCIRAALDAGLMDCVIVGRKMDGRVDVWSSGADVDAVIGLLHRGTHYLIDATNPDGTA